MPTLTPYHLVFPLLAVVIVLWLRVRRGLTWGTTLAIGVAIWVLAAALIGGTLMLHGLI